MLAGLLCVLSLGGALLVARSKLSPEEASRGAWQAPVRRREVAIGGALVAAAALLPLFAVAPWLSGMRPGFHADDMTHARIGADIAAHGLPHGWVDSYLGGFPFAVHYPPVTWLLVAALVRAGLSPAGAVAVLEIVTVVAAPLAVYLGAVAARTRITSAVAGGVLVAWVSPYNPFVGGFEVVFHLGLLSQALGLPLCVGVACAIATPRSRVAVVLLSSAAMSTHPQLSVATLIVTAAAVTGAARADAFVRWARAAGAAAITGGVLYGPGLRALHVPFGWPPMQDWRQIGFTADRLAWWLADGELLDLRRAPIVTAITSGALLVLVLRARRPAARALVAATIVMLAVSVSGPTLADAGPPWSSLLAFLQPLRMIALAPPLAAAVTIAALEEGATPLATACERLGRRRAAQATRALGAVLVVVLAVLALPARLRDANELGLVLRHAPDQPCGPLTPRDYASETIHGWLRALSNDRLAYWPTASSSLLACAQHDGLELSVPGPVAFTSGAGSHVGVHWLAFRQLRPDRAGSDLRAEALGVGYLLRVADGPPPTGWRVVQERGELQLLANERATRLVGVGCVRERWTGGDGAIRERLHEMLATADGADRLLSPTDLVALDRSTGPLEITSEPASDCDASGARVESRPREPGALEAEVSSPAPVDAVLRVAAFPTWTVELDGAPAAPRVVAPGFMAVRLPAGRHRIVAASRDVHGPSELAVLALGLVACAGLRRGGGARLRAALARLQVSVRAALRRG